MCRFKSGEIDCVLWSENDEVDMELETWAEVVIERDGMVLHVVNGSSWVLRSMM